MKKISIILSALVFALVLTQCKKEETPATTNDNNNGVMITLSVGNNSRADVDPNGNPNWATVSFEAGDYIYVGYNNAYVGYLECTSATTGTGYGHFEGTVTIGEVVEGGKLHFYMLGGKGFQPNPASITDNQLTVNLSDQTTKYPVISYATSNEEYVASTTTYTSDRLKNKCSIMKFNVTTPSTAPICITGMNNKVTLNFNPNTENTDQGFSYSVDTEDGGLIEMPAKGANNETWAIVLPQEELSAGAVGTAFTYDGYKGNRPALDAIASNQYITTVADDLDVSTFDINYMSLTLEALSPGTIKVNNPQSGMQYTKNGGAKTPVTSDAINVTTGDKVRFYGNGTSITSYYSTEDNYTTIAGGTAQVKVYGNIMSLVNETGYATLTTLPNQGNNFYGLFYQNTKLTDASGLLLPATTLAYGCYSYMFYRCTSLTAAPTLPATTLANYCYDNMFSRCTSLTTAPALPATTLAEGCYQQMFYDCALTTAPTLPATSLATGCYNNMFSGCTSLTTAPALPATTLAYNCYFKMFYQCTNLTTIPANMLPATTLANYCYSNMFSGCYNLETVPTYMLPATTLAEGCYSYMFYDCESLTAAPRLPATTLVNYCYMYMFYNCTSLSSIRCFATAGIDDWNTYYWVDGVASTGHFYKAGGVTWPTGENGIPSGWTVH